MPDWVQTTAKTAAHQPQGDFTELFLNQTHPKWGAEALAAHAAWREYSQSISRKAASQVASDDFPLQQPAGLLG